MAQLYWHKTISNRLILHENNGKDGASLIIEPFKNKSHENMVLVYQNSDIPVVRDKFEAMEESVEFDLDDYIFLLKSQINMLEEWKKGERHKEVDTRKAQSTF